MDEEGPHHLHRRCLTHPHRDDDRQPADDDPRVGLPGSSFVINSWLTGHGDVEVERTLSADNLYKGDDLFVELLVTNRSLRRTQILEVYDNILHEMKLRSGLNQIRVNLALGSRRGWVCGPMPITRALLPPWTGESAIQEHLQPLRGDDGRPSKRPDRLPTDSDVEEAIVRSRTPKMYTGANHTQDPRTRK